MRTVPAPVSTAPLRARHACTSARAASPLIHACPPEAGAVRASRLMASFSRTKGRPRSKREKKPALSSRACGSNTPTDTSIPAARRRAMPAPATRGFGSTLQHTTRATPAASNASAQGGVRPVWLHGSSVTYTVAPRACGPAARNAKTSACGSPARTCQPSPSTAPSRATTQPTRGFGSVVNKPRAASSSALAICA